MKAILINLVLMLLTSVSTIAQEYDSVKVFKYQKRLSRDTLVQSSPLHTSIKIDTIKRIVNINLVEDKREIRGIDLKQTGNKQFVFLTKMDWHPGSLQMYQLEIQTDKAVLYTHYMFKVNKYKYKLVFY